MKSNDNLFTTKIEIKKRQELKKLFTDWKNLIKTKEDIIFKDDGKAYPAIAYFNSDGFYPGYFSNKIKTLFIARESRDASGCDRVFTDIEFLKGFNPNSSAYWRRLFYIVEGIRNEGKTPFEKLPYAEEILKRMFAENNFGYAFMNISKYSNDSIKGGNADFDLINRFLVDSELDRRNFLREEIAILEPDVIITSNIWGGKIDQNLLKKVFPDTDLKYIESKSTRNAANVHEFRFNSRSIPLIDLYHFSSPGSDKEMYYEPVMKGVVKEMHALAL